MEDGRAQRRPRRATPALFDGFPRRERISRQKRLMATPAGAHRRPAVTTVRVVYSDLHGVARGKDVPLGEFARVGQARPVLLRRR